MLLTLLNKNEQRNKRLWLVDRMLHCLAWFLALSQFSDLYYYVMNKGIEIFLGKMSLKDYGMYILKVHLQKD